MRPACFFISAGLCHFFFATFQFMVSCTALLCAFHGPAFFIAPVARLEKDVGGVASADLPEWNIPVKLTPSRRNDR
jgi:hypothetical protein